MLQLSLAHALPHVRTNVREHMRPNRMPILASSLRCSVRLTFGLKRPNKGPNVQRPGQKGQKSEPIRLIQTAVLQRSGPNKPNRRLMQNVHEPTRCAMR